MNYCTNCGSGRGGGNFCGECGHRHDSGGVLVEEGYEDQTAAPVARSSSGGSGWLVVLGIALVLALVFGYGASRPDIDTSSPAYAEGRQAAAAYIASGAQVTAATTALQVCEVKVGSAANDEAKAAAANNEAGCKAALEEHLHPKG